MLHMAKILTKEQRKKLCFHGKDVITAHLAVYFGHYQTLDLLKNYYFADFSQTTGSGFTSLHIACLEKGGIVSLYFLK